MSAAVHRFETTYRRHLAREQRKAVMETLRTAIPGHVCVGDIVDAAHRMGLNDDLETLSLRDLADALLEPLEPAANEVAMSKSDASEGLEDAPHETRPSPSSQRKALQTPRRSAAELRRLRDRFNADEPMSLEEAAQFLCPMIEELGQATMQRLEDRTGIGRRKLRFHVGQLVREGHLVRHGMGRGTYYTIA